MKKTFVVRGFNSEEDQESAFVETMEEAGCTVRG